MSCQFYSNFFKTVYLTTEHILLHLNALVLPDKIPAQSGRLFIRPAVHGIWIRWGLFFKMCFVLEMNDNDNHGFININVNINSTNKKKNSNNKK